ncbi:MAG TPA: hypothetical protein VFG23_08005 [Polyangia bacterium]|nr:hypothetical protein [Polyangia bacterium]
MSGRSSFISRPWRLLRWAGLAAAVPALWACTSRTLEAPVVTPTQSVTQKVTQKINSDIDILFMIDNSSSMTSMQTKLLAQLPVFMQVLAALPMGLPSVHVAVVSSDMGAPSDTDIGCAMTTASSDDGKFYTAPEGTCPSNDFNTPTDLFITDDAAGDTKNFSDPDNGTGAGLAKVFQCIALLGSTGCGFEHQLASIDRALGSDGNGGPTDPMFLRADAYLGIVMLTNEDDCSAPTLNSGDWPIYSLNGGDDSLSGLNAGPGGPLGNYRCNGKPFGGHRCQDLSAGSTDMSPQLPPLMEPADAIANNDMVTYSNCIPDDQADSGDELTPVATFVSHIKSLKSDPANQILVAAVTGVNAVAGSNPPVLAPTPYTVTWALGTGPSANEKIPNVNHLCGPTTDGSFADPAVRISAFVNAFGANGVLASICDTSYSSSMAAIAAKIGALITPKCISGTIQQINGEPNCTVTNEFKVNGNSTQLYKTIPACADNGGAAPCWQFLAANDPNNKCGGVGQALSVSTDPANPTPDSLDSSIQCSTCVAGIPTAGCPCLGTSADVAGCI